MQTWVTFNETVPQGNERRLLEPMALSAEGLVPLLGLLLGDLGLPAVA